MKHLKIAAEQVTINTESIAMEGIFEDTKDAIQKVVTKFKGSGDDVMQDIDNNDKAVKKLKNTLQTIKSKVSSASFDSTESKKVVSILQRLNIEAKTPTQLIRALKTIRSDMDRVAREVSRAATREQAELAMKDLADLLKGNGKIADDMVFTKKEFLEVLDCCIELCDSYEKMRRIKSVGMENGGDLTDFIVWLAEVAAFFIRIILIVNVLVLVLTNPILGLLGAALAIALSRMMDAMIDKLRTT